MRVLALGIALLLPFAVLAADAARDAAASFYRGHAEYRAGGGASGVPDRRRLAQLAPFITRELRRRMAAAKAEQVRCARAFPEDKPPWVEGDLFSSNFEGFTAFRVGRSRVRAGTAAVTVHFEYADGKSRVDWSDVLALRNESGRWRVDDVLYRAKFAFGNGFGGSLKASLKRIPAC